MAVLRVEKTKDFTVMSNHHLRNTDLSLKAKGLLSIILSLPENWSYTLEGLTKICKEGISSIRSGIDELIKAGYVERNRLRDEKGCLRDMEYGIHEMPVEMETSDPQDESTHTKLSKEDYILKKPVCAEPISDELMLEEPTLENPMLENLTLDNPMLENPTLENRRQLNTKESNTDIINTNKSNTKELNTLFFNVNPSINQS